MIVCVRAVRWPDHNGHAVLDANSGEADVLADELLEELRVLGEDRQHFHVARVPSGAGVYDLQQLGHDFAEQTVEAFQEIRLLLFRHIPCFRQMIYIGVCVCVCVCCGV